jgi:hypothetical protein
MNDFITNGTEIKQRIISEINNSVQCIYLAMAYFTDRDIANAIIESKYRGVFVDVILSSNQQNQNIKSLFLDAGIKLHSFDTGDARGIMHHKFCLIDNKIVMNGSFNYSYNASTNNVENIQVSDNLSTYTQFHDEFERLKYNIDNNLDLNEVNQMTKIEEVLQPMNPVETFLKQLNFLVFSSSELDTEVYKKNGYEKSKENLGNIDIFRTEYIDIKEQLRTFATNNSLGSKKNILSTNISNVFENAKSKIEQEKLLEIENLKRDFKVNVDQISDRISEFKNEKTLLESGNEDSGEKGLYQVNKEIEKNALDKKNIELSLNVKKFWNAGTILTVIGLCIFSFYLSIFFSSAIYKVFFEASDIEATMLRGELPSMPPLVDAKAFTRVYDKQGIAFGIITNLFFLIPILLSNLELLGSVKKWVNRLGFWMGVLIFDILVSTMVSLNQHRILQLRVGKEPVMQAWEVIKTGEFWLIFVFGMIPLIIMHFIISKIATAYKNSQADLVDSDKVNKIYILENEMIDLLSLKEQLKSKIEEKEISIKENSELINQQQIEYNVKHDKIVARFTDILNQIHSIFDEYNSKIISGKIFTEEILNSVISAYKSGFIEFFPEYFSPSEIANRVREIERTIQTS